MRIGNTIENDISLLQLPNFSSHATTFTFSASNLLKADESQRITFKFLYILTLNALLELFIVNRCPRSNKNV
jgi:hypothetical protein